MRHPLWILNSSLLFLLLFAMAIVALTRQRPVRWTSIEPESYVKPERDGALKIDIAHIYDNDLFDTYKKPAPEVTKQVLTSAFPPPPQPIPVMLPTQPAPHFLEPLQLSLRGVIIVGDDQKNRAIVENVKAKQEINVKIGDLIEDAQLVGIFKNRISLIRSNGQEELIYLRAKDAAESEASRSDTGIGSCVSQRSDDFYLVDPYAFVAQIPTLAALINALDLTSVYRQGKSFGVRVGTISTRSCASALGFQTGDIITAIDGMSTANSDKRLEIYNTIVTRSVGDIIKLQLIRAGQPITCSIELAHLTPAYETLGTTPQTAQRQLSPDEIKHEGQERMAEKYQFAPTLDEIRRREKHTVLKKIKRHEEEERLQTRSPRFDM